MGTGGLLAVGPSRRSGLDAVIRAALASASDPASDRAKDAFSPWHHEEAAAPVESWFAEQLSGALVRATEEAARADIAWRGLDELLCTQQDLLRWAVEKQLFPEARQFRRGLVEICALADQAESARTKLWFCHAKKDLDVIDTCLAEHADLLAAPTG